MTSRPRIDFASEKGMTLVELLVTIPMALAVAGSIMTLTNVFSRNEKATANRSAAITQAQVALDRMTRDIRQASVVADPSTGTSAAAGTYTGLQLTLPPGSRPSGTILWSCTTLAVTSTCSRQVNSGPAIDQLTVTGTNAIFTVRLLADSDPTMQVSISVTVPTTVPVDVTKTFALTDTASPLNR
jgi:Tfp pilus assembly protein PilW